MIRIKVSGVMRCCIESAPFNYGVCKYCAREFVLFDGTWRPIPDVLKSADQTLVKGREILRKWSKGTTH